MPFAASCAGIRTGAGMTTLSMSCRRSTSPRRKRALSCSGGMRRKASTMDRRLRALEQVEARELKSLETELLKERRVRERARGGGNRMPALTLELKPPGRRDAAWRAKNRHPSRAALEETEQAPPELPQKPTTIREEFTRAAGGNSGHGGGAGAAGSSDGGRRRLPPSRGIHPAKAASATGIVTIGSDRAISDFWSEPMRARNRP